MKRTCYFLITVFMFIIFASCDSHDNRIDTALSLAENQKADSALNLLKNVDQTKLSGQDLAMYSLVYTIAQDKSGIDVDNDSLLRNAYIYYNIRPNDTLYAKCQYYMGKYYALNDSSEKALNCFSKSIKEAKKTYDYLTESMALLQSSVILSVYDVNKSICYAYKAYDTYNLLRNGNTSNKAYLLLNLAECYSYKKGKMDTCLLLTNKALGYATASKDSTVIADVLQDLSNFYDMSGQVYMALKAAEESFNYRPSHDVPAILTLCNAMYKVGETEQAKDLLSKIKIEEYGDYGDVIYTLRRLIALADGDLKAVNAYADSTETFLTKKNVEELSVKDKYYKLLVAKETKRATVQKESNFKTILIFATLTIAILVILFIIIRVKEGKRIQKMEIENKELQIENIRSFLLKKIDVVKKMMEWKDGKNGREKENEEKNGKEEEKGDNGKGDDKKPKVMEDKDWEELEVFLDNADGMFVKRIKEEFPALTKKDIRFLMLIRLRLPINIIAEIYHIKDTSVRQKLFLIKPKLGLKSGDDSAKEFIENY